MGKSKGTKSKVNQNDGENPDEFDHSQALMVDCSIQEKTDLISKLRRKKTALYAKLTNFENFFDLIKASPINESRLVELEMRIDNLKSSILSEFSSVQLELENLEPDEFDFSETELFENLYYLKISEAQQFLVQYKQKQLNTSHSFQTSQVLGAKMSGAKLPVIELPKFSGVCEQWLEFRDLYLSLVHNCDYIDPVDKFHYLRSSLEGSAARCINSVEFCADNYELAWDILCSRYNNKRLMVHNYMKFLFSIKNVDSDSPMAYRDLVDCLTKNLKCLESLGINTESWDPFIVYLVTSKLDSSVLKEWEKQEFKQDLSSFKELISFLSNYANILEKVNMHHKSKSKDRHFYSQKERSKSFVEVSKIKNSLDTSKEKYKFSCYYCHKPHPIYKCVAFIELSYAERRQKVTDLKLCANCLQQGHAVDSCKFRGCKSCSEKHHSLLHPSSQKSNAVVVEKCSDSEQEPVQADYVSTSCCNHSSGGQILLATTLVYIRDDRGKQHEVRALLDSASMSNFISQNTVARLGLKSEKVNFSIVGIGHTESSITSACNLQFSSRSDTFRANIRCLIIPEITGNLPGVRFDPYTINIPNNVELADPQFYNPSKVDMLIGADTFWNIVEQNTINLGKNKPLLIQTKLGWVISGPFGIQRDQASACYFSRSSDIQCQLSKFWEIEEVDYKPIVSDEHVLAESHFVKTHKRQGDERFVVSVPLKEPASKLGDSAQVAKNQFLKLERRFLQNPKLKDMYSDFMNEYQALGHMTVYNPEKEVVTYYSPHHGVLREDHLTTKLRVVFNCSVKSSSGLSYNDIQMVGPTVQDDLQSILFRFRQHAYVVSADVCKMYRQILVENEFRPLQLIFWRDKPEDPLQTFSLNTVTYGTASAPFLATRCLNQLAIENESMYPNSTKVIRRDFYVDDFLSGKDTVEEAVQLCHEVASILESGCFGLRKWKSNNQTVLNGMKGSVSSTDIVYFNAPEESKTLGMVWSCTSDSLSFQITIPVNIKRITKRVILSETAKIFDPLGLVSPVIIVAKIFLQSLWSNKLSWDQEIPDELKNKWLQFRSELYKLNLIKFPRHISCKFPKSLELHGFADASQAAYGACAYVRTVDEDDVVHVHLLCSKTRVSPLKTVSIPRLELCAAVLLAKLVTKVCSSLTLKFTKCVLWSDSTVTLAWIKASSHTLQVFVGNRVTEIQNLTNVSDWRYVPTSSNPADILSRGLSPSLLINSNLWFHGPEWLHQSSEAWPVDISLHHPIDDLPETRKNVRAFEQVSIELFPFKIFSSFTRITRVTAYCLRFAKNLRLPKDDRQLGSLTLEEMNEAKVVLVKVAQRESFPNEIQDLSNGSTLNCKSRVLSLTPFLCDGILRVGGRLKQSSFSYGKRHPILLSSKHYFTHLIFKFEHNRLLHCSPQLLLSHVRETYWPVAARNLARRVVRECIVCFKFKPKSPFPLMGNLPGCRVTPQPPFTHTGVDYAGPFFIRDRPGRGSKTSKCYLCLFICMTTKAVHLELVSSLSTPAFLETFQRFVARRGKPLHIYSDNGSNFVGARNELNELGEFLVPNHPAVKEKLEQIHGCKWHFIAAYSPHQGGIWEAGVKSAKHHLKRIIAGTLLTFESFYTVLTQIESILNARPLTPMSAEPNDLEALTPAHFLIGRSLQAVAYPDVQDVPMNRLTHFQMLERVKQQFWTRWSREYITQLQVRSKWNIDEPNVTEGTLVLVRDDLIPSYKWRLGRIVNVQPGHDNIVRNVTIQTSNGLIKRAVQKICPLPLSKT